MEETERLWVKAILIAFGILVLTTGSCEVHETAQKAKVAIELGDPLAAKCLFAASTDGVCIIYATRRESR